ncbi:YIP1 family protein [Nostoc sp.]|uniref:YIP1 family protein n=1 Tax=Nostoc sp. TaxID=1180 RepID=UPI00359423F8
MVRSIRTKFWKALTLNEDFYSNIPDNAAHRQFSRLIVLLAALSYSIGSVIILAMNREAPITLAISFVIGMALIVGSYYFWAFTIGKLLQWTTSDLPSHRGLLNLIGFSYAPQLFALFTLIPLLGRPIELLLNAWSLFAIITALRHKLNIKLLKAFLVCLPGWLLSNIGIGTTQILQ